MVLADILIALAAERGDEREVVDKLYELFYTTLVGGEDVDDRAERSLVNDFIVLWLTAYRIQIIPCAIASRGFIEGV